MMSRRAMPINYQVLKSGLIDPDYRALLWNTVPLERGPLYLLCLIAVTLTPHGVHRGPQAMGWDVTVMATTLFTTARGITSTDEGGERSKTDREISFTFRATIVDHAGGNEVC